MLIIALSLTMLLNSRTILVFIFIICFLENIFSKFLLISSALILFGLRTDEVKIYSDVVNSYQMILNLSDIFNQCFIVIYSPLIFVCVWHS